MPASFPSSAKAFTTKSDGPGNTILAAHINDVQLEVTAIEQCLLGSAAFNLSVNGTGTFTGNLTTAASLAIASTQKLLLDGVAATGDTYLTESAANTIRVFVGGAQALQIDGTTGIQAFAAGPILDGTGVKMATWPTTASAANAHVADGNYVRLSTSLRAHKHDILDMALEDAQRTILTLRPVVYRSQVDADQRQWPGFIAEETEAANPHLAMYGADGALQGVAYDRVPAYLVRLVQDQEERIRALEAARG